VGDFFLGDGDGDGGASQAACRLGATYAILYSIPGLRNLL